MEKDMHRRKMEDCIKSVQNDRSEKKGRYTMSLYCTEFERKLIDSASKISGFSLCAYATKILVKESITILEIYDSGATPMDNPETGRPCKVGEMIGDKVIEGFIEGRPVDADGIGLL